MNIKWFRRGDGILFSTTEGSASDELMMREGEFTACDENGKNFPIEASDNDSDESKTDADKSAMEDGNSPEDPGQGGAAERSRAGDGDQEDDLEQQAGGTNVPEGSDNEISGGEKSASKSKASKRKPR